MKLMFDTQIYDLVVAQIDMLEKMNDLNRKELIEIYTTHIQRDEILDIPDLVKKERMMLLITKLVPTNGAVYGVSKYGMATYGDGSLSALFSIDDFRPDSKKHTKDALIATTTARDVDVLVTVDARFSKKMKALGRSPLKIKQFESRISRW